MKFSIILICFCFAFSLGCKKVLDKRLLDAVREDVVWNDLDLVKSYVNRIYADNLPGWSSEYAAYTEEATGGGSYLYGQLTENSVDYWPYEEIRKINTLIVNMDKSTLAVSYKNQFKAEALFFRAWRYFEMVKRYGGVPLVLTPQDRENDDLYVKRATTSATFNQIIADLDTAATYLPTFAASNAGNNDGHLHKGTALALKGRVLLYYASPQFDPSQTVAGRWQKAYDANKAAKDYLDSKGFGLYPNFTTLWLNEMNKEAIFVRRYLYNPSNSESWHNWSAATRPLDISQGATGANRPTLEIINAFPMKDGKPINDPTSAYTYDPNYFWKNRDPRFWQTIVYNGALYQVGINGLAPGRIQWTYVGGEQNNPTVSGYYMRKAIDTTQTSIQAFNSSTDWIELRYAEVLLNLAESANEIGNTTEAYPLLTAIRARAGIDPGSNNLYGLKAGLTKAEMRQAIRLERQIELAYESKRFWDLRRWRAFETTLNGTRRHGHTITLKVAAAQWNTLRNSMSSQQLYDLLQTSYTTYFQHTVKELDTQFDISWKPEYYFFAIPSEHLQLNNNLEQTAGWAGGTFDPLK
jgi:starch-binding outer membrane protein, SusD/RagB family